MSEENKDIRWQQRFVNFNKAFLQLEKYVGQQQMNELEEQGLIKSFEYTYELAWKTLQDLLSHIGYKNIVGPKPVIEQCFQDGFISNGEAWLRMHNSRNLTSHTYNQETAKEIVEQIISEYYHLLKDLQNRLENEKNSN
jgi:nucleotidyltransferase substrate binding protein (TIGR01987 family)